MYRTSEIQQNVALLRQTTDHVYFGMRQVMYSVSLLAQLWTESRFLSGFFGGGGLTISHVSPLRVGFVTCESIDIELNGSMIDGRLVM